MNARENTKQSTSKIFTVLEVEKLADKSGRARNIDDGCERYPPVRLK